MLTIGRLGTLGDIAPKTLRYYDRVGLVGPPRAPRPATEYMARTPWSASASSAGGRHLGCRSPIFAESSLCGTRGHLLVSMCS